MLKRYLVAMVMVALLALSGIRCEVPDGSPESLRAWYNTPIENQKDACQEKINESNIKGLIVTIGSEGPQWDMSEVVNVHDEEYYSPRRPSMSYLCKATLYMSVVDCLQTDGSQITARDKKEFIECCTHNKPLASWPKPIMKKLLNKGLLDDLGACDFQGTLCDRMPEKSLKILLHMIKNGNI